MAIDPFHKSHDASVPYPTMQYFVTEMCTFLLQNVALWDICLMHCGICEMGLFYCECLGKYQGSFCECVQPMREGVTL